MTVALSWPSAIPLPSIDGYQLKPKPNVARTEMDVGPALQRRRSTQTPTEIPVQFKLTLWEQALMEGFYRDKAMEGAVWFNVTLLGGVGLTNHEARFKGEIAYRPVVNGERWIATAILEVRDRPQLSGADFDVLVGENPDVLFAGVEAFHATMAAPPLWASGDDLYLIYGEDMAYLLAQCAAFHAAMASTQLWPD